MEQGEIFKNIILEYTIGDLLQEVLLLVEIGHDLEDIAVEEATEIDLEDVALEATEIDLNLLVRTDFEGDLTPEEEEMIVIDSDCLETFLNVLDVTVKIVKE